MRLPFQECTGPTLEMFIPLGAVIFVDVGAIFPR